MLYKIAEDQDAAQLSLKAVTIIKELFESKDKGNLLDFIEHYFILEEELNDLMINKIIINANQTEKNSNQNITEKDFTENLTNYIAYYQDKSKFKIPQKSCLGYVVLNTLILRYLINSSPSDIELIKKMIRDRLKDSYKYDNLLAWLKNNIKNNEKYFDNLLKLFDEISKDLSDNSELLEHFYNLYFNFAKKIDSEINFTQKEKIIDNLIRLIDFNKPETAASKITQIYDKYNSISLKLLRNKIQPLNHSQLKNHLATDLQELLFDKKPD
ncbi:hypothetical protein [Aquella oligotrophica]|uniref:Uncharacterized protein n=1 Tax=Aquella oligotrophica TaxID=2067065 RepID=A0A2I7N3K4_9NEIS|nr:hypothetical protein [Aquella oligotrophica]AUR51023.1 hypothetical protein CUN60_01455 [Aquella oligotrophica]